MTQAFHISNTHKGDANHYHHNQDDTYKNANWKLIPSAHSNSPECDVGEGICSTQSSINGYLMTETKKIRMSLLQMQ